MSRTEHAEQVALVQWADYQRFNGEPIGNDLFSIPNGARCSMSQAKRLKAEGLRAGVPDLMLGIPVAQFHGLFIEMKSMSGYPSPEQRKRIERLNSRGYKAVCVRGYDAARIEIERYLALAGRLYINGSAH